MYEEWSVSSVECRTDEVHSTGNAHQKLRSTEFALKPTAENRHASRLQRQRHSGDSGDTEEQGIQPFRDSGDGEDTRQIATIP